MSHLTLAGDGAVAGRSDWEREAAAVLRKSGRLTADDPDSAAWAKLARTTLDGFAIPPLGTASDLDDLVTVGRPTRTGTWDVRALVTGPDAATANREALEDLEGGATSIWLKVDASLGADLSPVLERVLLDLAPVVLDSDAAQLGTAQAFLSYVGDIDLPKGTNLGASPFSDDLVPVAKLALERGVRGVVVNAINAHNMGASDVQELGASIAEGAMILRKLTAAGFSVDEAAGVIEFRYAATVEQFPTIAKLRAARRLWARVLELSGATDTTQAQHAVTSRPMLSKYDPYVNLLRTTVAGFAAGVGGADAVSVLPFDIAVGRPTEDSRRLARNISHLLVDEAHVAVVTDPAGGAYAVEKLTDDLAIAAWDELGRLETDGFGPWVERVGQTVAARDKLVATRRKPITGLTEFPNLGESLPVRDGQPDEVRRYGAAFEAMRDAPAASHVFLATLGSVAQHTARATFASNLLAAGGVAVDEAGPTNGVDDLLAAYNGQRVVVLAGTDAAYDAWGADAAAGLRAAGAPYIVVAGKPADYADDNAAAGGDALAFLTRVREELAK